MKYTYDAEGEGLKITAQPGTLTYPLVMRTYELEPDVKTFQVDVTGQASIRGYLPVRLDVHGEKLYPVTKPVVGRVTLIVKNVSFVTIDCSKLSELERLTFNLVQLELHEKLTRYTAAHSKAKQDLANAKFRIAQIQGTVLLDHSIF